MRDEPGMMTDWTGLLFGLSRVIAAESSSRIHTDGVRLGTWGKRSNRLEGDAKIEEAQFHINGALVHARGGEREIESERMRQSSYIQ